MLVEEELARSAPGTDTLLTIGVFDGVHLGHKYLISKLKERARQKALHTGVVTFRQHPQQVICPQVRLPFLTDLTEKTSLLKNEGVDTIVVLSFTPELARLSAHQFLALLKKYLKMQGLVIGPDFALGSNREGNTDTLHALGQEMGFSVTVLSPMMINGEVVSSTAIRKALAEGNMEKVHKLIGRCFSLQGRVVPGVRRGIGFPTANIDVKPEQAMPADGVYASRAYIDSKAYQSVTNIGTCPTFGNNLRTVEVYILDYDGDLYGDTLRIDIVERLRGEKKFSSAEKLSKQIAEDIKQARAILDSSALKVSPVN